MRNYLEEYKAYYRVRAKRYAGDPDFPFTAEAEQNLCDAMLGCNELIEFKQRLGNLNDLCGVAYTKDTYALRLKHYREIEETIRALGPERIINKAGQFNNVFDLMTMIGEEENINSREISMDHISPFDGNWFLLERLEVYERAEIPSKWQPDVKEMASEIKKSLSESLRSTEADMQKWEPGWKLKLPLAWETRHRRKLPYPDAELKRRIGEFEKTTK